jgi:hypothetical protein
MLLRSNNTVEIKFFSNFFLLVDGRIRIRTYNNGSGYQRFKKYLDPDMEPWVGIRQKENGLVEWVTQNQQKETNRGSALS